MEKLTQLQELIGTDKKNPFFTVCKNSQQPGKLLIYYGMTLLEVVEDNPEHPTFKLLVARLYNSGLKVKSLTRTFGVPYTTLRRWGDVLKSGDTEKLLRMLAGRKHPRKLTPEVRSFVKQRFADIYPLNPYNYSQRIRNELQEVFDISVSAESLRLLFNDGKQHTATPENDVTQIPTPVIQALGGMPLAPCDDVDENHHEVGEEYVQPTSQQPLDEDNRKHVVVSVKTEEHEGYQFCHHAGVLMFSLFLNQLDTRLGACSAWIKQWIVTILLGAANIEQSKLLNAGALKLLLGEVNMNMCQQRRNLAALAMTDCLEKMVSLNGEWAGLSQSHDFYYDPHSKHYTGGQPLLKGWCTRLRFAEKVLHMDFIHTVSGFPVYIHHDDNFYDLRERFLPVVKAFRQQFSMALQRPLTFVIDRGIYGMDMFNQIMSDDANTYFVTWEKGYQSATTKMTQWTGTLKLYKVKNNSHDLRCYSFRYQDETWPSNHGIRRLIVEATNYKGNTIEVSILTNHKTRNAIEVIELMFSRWLQENDFKYLDVHFGINEITSYAVIPYRLLAQTQEDKQMKSGAYKALEKQRVSIKQKLKTHLLQKHRAKKVCHKRAQKIDNLTEQLKQIERVMESTDKEISRLSSLIEQGYCKLDTQKKSLMDGIKITARNLFYVMLEPFKEAYNNYRDDHVLFRHLTRAHGLIRQHEDRVEVILLTEAKFPPKVVNIIEGILAELNTNGLTMPDGSGKALELKLFQQEQVAFMVNGRKSGHTVNSG